MSSEDDDYNPVVANRLGCVFDNSNQTELSFDVTKIDKAASNFNLSHVSRSSASESRTTCLGVSSVKLIIAKVVKAFIFMNGKYETYGKLAIALLGNSSLKHYQIILYRDKSNHVTKSIVTSNFWFGVQGNNYASFYDVNNAVWTVMFDSTANFILFSTELTLAKWMCNGCNHNEILVQDLITLNTGKKVQQYDTVKIRYEATSLDDKYRPLKEFAATGLKVFHLTLNDEWEKYVVDVVENSRRLLIIPKIHAEPWGKLIGTTEKFGFQLDLTIEGIIGHQPLPNQLKPSDNEMVLPKLPFILNELSSNKITIQNNDVSELSTENLLSTKPDLISRTGHLNKMTLPGDSPSVFTSLDSDETEEDTSSTNSVPSNRNSNRTKPQKMKQKPTLLSSFSHTQQPVMPCYSKQQLVSGPVVGYPALTTYSPVAAVSPVVNQQLPVLFSELRTQNSELRMGLNSIADKVEKIIDKIQAAASHQLVQQLESLNKKIMDQFSYFNQLNDELQKNLLKQHHEGMNQETEIVGKELKNEKIEELQKENTKLLDTLVELKNCIAEIQEKISKGETEKLEIEEMLLKENKAATQLKEKLMSTFLELNGKSADQITKKLVSCLHNLTANVELLEKSLDELNLTADNINCGPSSNDIEETDALIIRESMNSLYKLLKSQFKSNLSYTSADINDTFKNIYKSFS